MASPGSVLFIVEDLPSPFDRRVWMEATSLRRAGYDVAIICPTGKGFESEREDLERVRIYRHTLPPERNSASGYLREYWAALRAEFGLARGVRRERPFDIVHICNPPDVLFLVALWCKVVYGCRVVFDQHDINPELYEAKYGRRDIFYWGLRVAERMTFRTADVVIATNESYRAIALSRGHKNPDDVFIVRSGPDLSRFGPVASNDRYRRGFRHLVGYVGVMGEQDGIDILLRAAAHVVFELGRDDVGFMLIGSGPVAEQMRRLAGELGLERWVEFAGRVPDEELLEGLSTCDICVNPDPKNPFNDSSTMNKVLQYMALGKPIVQFDLKEGRRSAGEASLYATPNDHRDLAGKIVELLDDPAKRARMGAAGRRHMETDLEWRHQEKHLLATYRRVTTPRRH